MEGWLSAAVERGSGHLDHDVVILRWVHFDVGNENATSDRERRAPPVAHLGGFLAGMEGIRHRIG